MRLVGTSHAEMHVYGHVLGHCNHSLVLSAGADIDVLCVGPMYTKREEHVFGTEPYCLETVLRSTPGVSDVQPVPKAFVPVIKVVVCLMTFNVYDHSSVCQQHMFDCLASSMAHTMHHALCIMLTPASCFPGATPCAVSWH